MSTSSPVCLVGVGESACWELISDFFVEDYELYIDELLIQRGVYAQASSSCTQSLYTCNSQLVQAFISKSCY